MTNLSEDSGVFETQMFRRKKLDLLAEIQNKVDQKAASEQLHSLVVSDVSTEGSIPRGFSRRIHMVSDGLAVVLHEFSEGATIPINLRLTEKKFTVVQGELQILDSEGNVVISLDEKNPQGTVKSGMTGKFSSKSIVMEVYREAISKPTDIVTVNTECGEVSK